MRNMSHMMERCMRFMKEKGSAEGMGETFGSPKEMFRSMMGDGSEKDELAKYTTPELRALFEDWLLQMEEEINAFTKTRDTIAPEEVAEAFKISRESAIFLMDKIAQKEKLDIGGRSDQKEEFHGNDG